MTDAGEHGSMDGAVAAIRRILQNGEPEEPDSTGRDGAGRDGAGRDGAGRDGAGRDETGRDETGRDETGRDETGRDETGRDGEDDVFLLTREMMVATPDAPDASGDGSDDGDGPLVLTPDMLADEKPRAPAGGSGSDPGEVGREAAPIPAKTAETDAGRPIGEEPSAPTRDEKAVDRTGIDKTGIDESVVERIVRRILREELAGAADDPLPADVRSMIRTEVERLLSDQSEDLAPARRETWRTGEDSNPRPPDS